MKPYYRVICFCISFFLSNPIFSHPWGGLEIDQEGTIHFSHINPIVGNEHYACIWQIDEQGSLKSSLLSKHSPSDLILIKTPKRKLFAAERFGYAPNQSARLWSKSAGVWAMDFEVANQASIFFVQACLVDDEELIYFAHENKLYKRDVTGEVESFMNDITFDRIDDLAWGPNHSIFILEKSSVSIITADEQHLPLISNLREENPEFLPFDGANILFDIAVDENGNTYLAYFGNRQILKINREGEKSIFHQSVAPWAPHGVDIRNGEVFWLESSVATGVPHIVARVCKATIAGKVENIYSHPQATEAEAAYAANQQKSIPIWVFCGGVVLIILLVTKFRKRILGTKKSVRN